MAASLVQHGANIYWSEAENFEKASDWHELRSLWVNTIGWDVEAEWFRALEENDTDVDEYRWEDIRRRKQAMRLRGATRSGVDERVLDLPSISGLRCRSCRRKYCDIHHRGIFDEPEDESEGEFEDEFEAGSEDE